MCICDIEECGQCARRSDAVAYIQEVLGVPLQVVSVYAMRGSGAEVRRIGAKVTRFRITEDIGVGSFEGQRVLWHEIAHVIDEAVCDRRSSFTSRWTSGRYSSPNVELLRQNASFINAWSRPELIVNIGGTKKGATAWLEDPKLPSIAKQQIRLKALDFGLKADQYQRQCIELFANGFARWIVCPISVASHDRRLAALFAKVARQHGISPRARVCMS